ncbi:hypothetical protein ADU37_CDS03350 [Thermococcus sp. 2319x1]|nr:hypothetical protein ADU37_CDS03350 [Thermococcus sp. 2319x1]
MHLYSTCSPMQKLNKMGERKGDSSLFDPQISKSLNTSFSKLKLEKLRGVVE